MSAGRQKKPFRLRRRFKMKKGSGGVSAFWGTGNYTASRHKTGLPTFSPAAFMKALAAAMLPTRKAPPSSRPERNGTNANAAQA